MLLMNACHLNKQSFSDHSWAQNLICWVIIKQDTSLSHSVNAIPAPPVTIKGPHGLLGGVPEMAQTSNHLEGLGPLPTLPRKMVVTSVFPKFQVLPSVRRGISSRGENASKCMFWKIPKAEGQYSEPFRTVVFDRENAGKGVLSLSLWGENTSEGQCSIFRILAFASIFTKFFQHAGRGRKIPYQVEWQTWNPVSPPPATFPTNFTTWHSGETGSEDCKLIAQG